jgi:hypothetical protein
VWEIEEVHAGFLWENLGKRDYWGDPGVDGRIILRWIFRKWDGGMDWIQPAKGRDSWRALVSSVMNVRVPKHARHILSS